MFLNERSDSSTSDGLDTYISLTAVTVFVLGGPHGRRTMKGVLSSPALFIAVIYFFLNTNGE